MDGKGRFLDNIFVERLWRALKYECVLSACLGDRIGGQSRCRQLDRVLQSANDPTPPLADKPPSRGLLAEKHRRLTQPGQQVQRVA